MGPDWVALTEKETAFLIKNMPMSTPVELSVVFGGGVAMHRYNNSTRAFELLAEYRTSNTEPEDGSYPVEWDSDDPQRQLHQ